MKFAFRASSASKEELVETKDEAQTFLVHRNKGISHYTNISVFFMVLKECNVRGIPYPTLLQAVRPANPFQRLMKL